VESSRSFCFRRWFPQSLGRNAEGQLGVGDPSLMKSSAPLLVDSLPSKDTLIHRFHVVEIILQYSMSNGELFSWGHG